MSAKQRAAKKRRKMIFFGIEVVLILAMLIVLYLVMSKTNTEGPKVTVLEPEELEISEEVVENETMKGYMNVALFGVDARSNSQLYKGSRSDSIMIASINMDTGDIKLVSVYRDTYLNIGTDKYIKCNHAYSNGGAEQAVKMLNMNLDMDIKDFVTVSYKGLSEVIDGLGGVYIDVDSEELKHINNYQIDIADVLKTEYKPVTEPGYQLLDGLQATAYCRIRYTQGDDFKRAARQREVIKAIEEQAKKASLNTLTKVFNEAIDDVYTSIDSKDILDLLGNIAKYKIVDEGGFPEESMRTTTNLGAKGSSVIPVDLESNVVWLHQFLFDDQNYSVTSSVKEYSQHIKNDVAAYTE
ncbi:MAG: LCP family protein [Acetatifactor sp.]|nr:LCP family protein [Acetatifactor sp.]